ncbi:MAG: hypothetical protein ACRDRY_13985 [Pseudonocardiaceae bacterium]
MFIPDLAWWEDEDGPVDFVPLRRADDLDAWLELAYGHDFVITQVDDGDPVGPGLRGADPDPGLISPPGAPARGSPALRVW